MNSVFCRFDGIFKARASFLKVDYIGVSFAFVQSSPNFECTLWHVSFFVTPNFLDLDLFNCTLLLV